MNISKFASEYLFSFLMFSLKFIGMFGPRGCLAWAMKDIMHKHWGFDLELQYMLIPTKMNICVCNFTPLLRDIVNQQVGWIYSVAFLGK